MHETPSVEHILYLDELSIATWILDILTFSRLHLPFWRIISETMQSDTIVGSVGIKLGFHRVKPISITHGATEVHA